MAGKLRIRNWDKWQSYRRDRGQPPWIKVHREVMRNIEWVGMTDAQRGQLVAIWLLAADHDGVIPASPDLVQKLCFMSEPPDLHFFMEQGFIDPDASLTPDRRQTDAEVTNQNRGRVETEIEEEKDSGASGDATEGGDAEDPPKGKNGKFAYPEEFEKLWAEKPDRSGPNPKLSAFKAYQTRLKQGATHEEIMDGLRKYRRHLEAEGKIGSRHVQMMKTFLGPDEHFREMDGLQSSAADDMPHWMRGGV